MSTVGIIGVGRMGTPIMGHLVRHGHEVRAFDLNADRRKVIEEAGASWCEDPEELARESEYILICVGYDRDVTELTARDGGLLDTAKQGSVIAILSTVLPDTVEALAMLGQEKGIDVVDATVFPVDGIRQAADVIALSNTAAQSASESAEGLAATSFVSLRAFAAAFCCAVCLAALLSLSLLAASFLAPSLVF